MAYPLCHYIRWLYGKLLLDKIRQQNITCYLVNTGWVGGSYSALNGKSPLMVWQDYIEQVKPLGHFASRLDEIFYHRVKRKVRKDGSISYEGKSFEVPYLLAQKEVLVVIDPYQQKAIYIENEEGVRIGDLTPLDLQANRNYKRRKNSTACANNKKTTHSIVDLAMQQQQQRLVINTKNNKT